MTSNRVLEEWCVNPDFRLAVGMDKVKGASYMRKFAFNPVLPSGVERDIWEFGSVDWGNLDYTYPLDGTAPIDSISSSSALDLDPIYIEGLDINGELTTQIIMLQGQTQVPLDTPLWRCYRMSNLKVTAGADRSLGFAGQIYCYEDTPIVLGVPTDPTKVKAFMDNGTNSTLQAPYTCPLGTTGYFLSVDVRNAKKIASGSVLIDAHIRDYARVFRLVDIGALSMAGTSNYVVENWIPVKLAPLSDIVMTANASTNGMAIGLVYYIILFDNVIWGLK